MALQPFAGPWLLFQFLDPLLQWFPTCGTCRRGLHENNIGNGEKHQKKKELK
jgi:hypothetical protein